MLTMKTVSAHDQRIPQLGRSETESRHPCGQEQRTSNQLHMVACDEPCRAALALAICGALDVYLPDSPNRTSDQARFMGPEDSAPLLSPRARLLHAEFGCAVERPPPLQPKWVPNGKSAMSFQVGGGAGVDPEQPASYSVLLKQLSSQEVALLPTLFPRLVEHYARRGGTLLAQLLGRVRYSTATGETFDAVLMENVARPPPGRTLDTGREWRPFDMKGIRLYPHEQRLHAHVGERGLLVGAGRFEAMRSALAADVALLKGFGLVDYSYLLSVFPTSAAPAPCDKVSREADFGPAPSTPRGFAGSARLFPAYFRATASGNPVAADASAGLCSRVLVRVAVIDYLREWGLVERVEHLQKKLVRDLVAGERNHAVVPVERFAHQFERFFGRGLFSPVHAHWATSPWDRIASYVAPRLESRLFDQCGTGLRIAWGSVQRCVGASPSRSAMDV